jgi:hypothetical protein
MPRNQVCELCAHWNQPPKGERKGECERTRGDIMLMDTFERVSAECSLATLPSDWCAAFEPHH